MNPQHIIDYIDQGSLVFLLNKDIMWCFIENMTIHNIFSITCGIKKESIPFSEYITWSST